MGSKGRAGSVLHEEDVSLRPSAVLHEQIRIALWPSAHGPHLDLQATHALTRGAPCRVLAVTRTHSVERPALLLGGTCTAGGMASVWHMQSCLALL